MSSPSRSRWLRAGVFACVSTGLSLGGHVGAAGHGVSPAALAAGFAGVLLLAWAAAGRERGFATILGWMLWSQIALHLVFSLAAPAPAAPGGADWDPHALHTGAAADPAGGMSAGMVLAHLAAAVVSAWWLRRGEAAAFALAEQLAGLVVGLLLILEPSREWAPAPVRPSRRSGNARTGRALRHVLVRRGPPGRAAGLVRTP